MSPAIPPDLRAHWPRARFEHLPGLDGGAWCVDDRLVAKRTDAVGLAVARAFAERGAMLPVIAGPAGWHVTVRALPGTSPADAPEVADVAPDLCRRLWSTSPPQGLPTVADVVGRWEPVASPEVRVLLASATGIACCHGDLHVGNVLRHGTGTVAIDAQPLLAEPAYDVEPLLRPALDAGDLRGADALLSLLAVDRLRALSWAMVRSGWYETASAGDPSRVARWRGRRQALRALGAEESARVRAGRAEVPR